MLLIAPHYINLYHFVQSRDWTFLPKVTSSIRDRERCLPHYFSTTSTKQKYFTALHRSISRHKVFPLSGVLNHKFAIWVTCFSWEDKVHHKTNYLWISLFHKCYKHWLTQLWGGMHCPCSSLTEILMTDIVTQFGSWTEWAVISLKGWMYSFFLVGESTTEGVRVTHGDKFFTQRVWPIGFHSPTALFSHWIYSIQVYN